MLVPKKLGTARKANSFFLQRINQKVAELLARLRHETIARSFGTADGKTDAAFVLQRRQLALQAAADEEYQRKARQHDANGQPATVQETVEAAAIAGLHRPKEWFGPLVKLTVTLVLTLQEYIEYRSNGQ